MKKYILILLIISININAKTLYDVAKAVNIDYGNGYTGWTKCQYETSMDFDRRIIFICTDVFQIYHIKYIDKSTHNNYNLIECYAVDRNNIGCYVDIYIYNNGVYYIKIIYSDITIKYKLNYSK